MVNEFYKIITSSASYDSWIKLNFLSGGGGQCVAEMRVAEEHINMMGTLHGGCTASLVDVVSTVALMSQCQGLTSMPVAGVSVDLNITYLKAAKLGEDILIDAKTLKAGQNLAFLSVDIRNKADGSLIATGKHTKFIGQGQVEAKTVPKTNL